MQSQSHQFRIPRSVHLLAAVAAAITPISVAIAEALQLDIAAEQAPVALKEFIRQSGLQLVFEFDVVRDHKTRAIKGEFEAADALRAMLAGTGLVFQFVNERTVTISRKDGSADATAGAAAPARGASRADTPASAGPSATNVVSPGKNTHPTGVLEEILVTAEKRSESIQSLPIAISAFSGETLTNKGIDTVEGLQQAAPSLTIGGGNGPLARVSLRGVGTEVGDFYGDPAVAISQDGVSYANRFLLAADLFDVERVEVLRGPQGTISGRNATAGAINIHSKRPTEEFEGGVKMTVGNYNRVGAEGYLSGPLAGNRLLGRLAVRSDNADGWVDNTLLGKELGTIDALQVRGSLLGDVTDDLEAHLIVEGTRNRSTPVNVDDGRIRSDRPSVPEFTGVPAFDRDRHVVQHDQPGDTEYEKYQASLKLTWDMGSSARLTTTTGYVDLKFSSTRDADGTAAVGTTWSQSPDHPLRDHIWQISQEATVTVDLSDRLDVIAGALYLQAYADQDVRVGLPSIGVPPGSLDFFGENHLTSWSGYTQWRYRLADDLRLSAGVRYTHDSRETIDRSFSFGNPVFEDERATWNAWTPRLALDYTPTDDLTVYAALSRGFKSGGFVFGTHPVNEFDPEYVWNYEIGLKADWLDQRLKATVAGFYMQYTDLQQSIQGVDPTQTFSSVVNANSATIKGVELDVSAMLSDGFLFTFAGAWLDATYDELRSHDPIFPELGVPGPFGVNVRDLSGNRVVRAPEWKLNVSGEYRVPLGMRAFGADLQGVLRASYAWQSKVFFDLYNHAAISQDPYGLVNLSAAVESADGSWELSTFVHNLTDEYYRTDEGTFGSIGVQASSVVLGRPRTYGVSLAYRF